MFVLYVVLTVHMGFGLGGQKLIPAVSPEGGVRATGALDASRGANGRLRARWRERTVLHRKQQEVERWNINYAFLNQDLGNNSEMNHLWHLHHTKSESMHHVPSKIHWLHQGRRTQLCPRPPLPSNQSALAPSKSSVSLLAVLMFSFRQVSASCCCSHDIYNNCTMHLFNHKGNSSLQTGENVESQ